MYYWCLQGFMFLLALVFHFEISCSNFFYSKRKSVIIFVLLKSYILPSFNPAISIPLILQRIFYLFDSANATVKHKLLSLGSLFSWGNLLLLFNFHYYEIMLLTLFENINVIVNFHWFHNLISRTLNASLFYLLYH